MADAKTYALVLHEIRALNDRRRADITRSADELRHLVRLAIALLAGILAALGLIGQAGWAVPRPPVVLTATSLAGILTGAMDAVRSAAGLADHEVPLGPDPEALVSRIDDLTEPALQAALAEAEARQCAAADRLGRLLARAVRRVTRVLLASTVLAAIAMALIVGGAIR